MTETFDGQVTIKVRFNCKAEYQKFRMYVLKTDWDYGDFYPTWEELKMEFHSVEDLDRVTRVVVDLLQMGFEVYSTRYKLDKQLAEEEHPPEGDTDGDEAIDPQEFDLDDFCKELQQKIRGIFCDDAHRR